MPRREQAKMVKQLRKEGYQVAMNGGDHWQVCDAQGRFLAVFPQSTANWRWVDNLRTKMRRREREYAEQDQLEGAEA